MVRRPSHGRLLAAVPAARAPARHPARRRPRRGRRRRAVRRCWRAAWRRRPARGARRVAVPRRRDEQRRDRADAVHARDRARRRRLGLRAPLAARGRRALARQRLGEPGGAACSSCVAAVAMLAGVRDLAARRRADRARARRARAWSAAADGAAVPRGRLGPLHRHGVLADAARLPRRARAGRPVAPHGHLGRGASTWPCSSPRSRSPTRSGRTRCASASCSGRRCSSSSRGRARRAPRSWSSPPRCSTCSGCPPCAPSRRRAGTRRPRRRSTRRCSTSSRPRARPGERLEVPLTRNHWEATYLAEDYPLARGWHRQLDRKVNPLFYDREHPLTLDALQDWLRENAVRWVALPERAARLLRARRARAAARGPPVPRARARVGALARSGRSATPSRRSSGRRAADRGRRGRLRPRGDARRAR